MKFTTSNITLAAFLIATLSITFDTHGYSFDLDKLKETTNLVKAGNKYVTLLGDQVNVGEQAPTFKVVDKNFSPVTLNDFQGQTLLISVVPSLDTGVCSIQTKRFNEEAAKLPKNITILTISNDLPFAQKRFCDVENVDGIKILSDSVWREFGANYGLLIKDMGLLTRAIFIINDQGKIVYKELVANISQHPNYDKALSKVKYTAPVIVLDGDTVKNQLENPTETK
ncbi:thiol peroxidase [Colwellia psychrerythraea]|uniref:Redoxin domain protein n=1 Tax=Colwellia psychrerythraea TaxID=28229 RepID=A0A099L2T6_COLPS|nr:thiol peroxidase [Colwellia psychrerythraea]KGJ96163.1 Redoxin domain protein [Colwellia psychrerythraea]